MTIKQNPFRFGLFFLLIVLFFGALGGSVQADSSLADIATPRDEPYRSVRSSTVTRATTKEVLQARIRKLKKKLRKLKKQRDELFGDIIALGKKELEILNVRTKISRLKDRIRNLGKVCHAENTRIRITFKNKSKFTLYGTLVLENSYFASFDESIRTGDSETVRVFVESMSRDRNSNYVIITPFLGSNIYTVPGKDDPRIGFRLPFPKKFPTKKPCLLKLSATVTNAHFKGDPSAQPTPKPEEQYYLFVLTNAGNTLYIGQEISLFGRYPGSFQGGGTNYSEVVTYSKLEGPFNAERDAEAAFCAGVTEKWINKVVPWGPFVRFKGKVYGAFDSSVEGPLASCPNL